jgi:hypothetical protein
MLTRHIHVPLSQDEATQLQRLAGRAKMPMTQYVRMLIAKDYGDYKSQEQKDREFFLGESSDNSSSTR